MKLYSSSSSTSFSFFNSFELIPFDSARISDFLS
ncbi:unnamed protein product [Arabidopsis thaliana]|uniref:(thale cress) hypothetical protein n=1 Tax=Arabidopsis thaliana TaxID=3702 RepID=A0A7G2F2S3_ARATH|nr:unnamed protein product [Arabidopsis thaliana]